MDKFTKLTGVAAPLPLINVDTDMIIPKQFLKTIQRSGLGKNLFDEMRYDDDGNEIADFVLNQPAYRERGDPRRGRKLRLRFVARTRALGAAGFRHPLRDRAVLRRHLLQQLLQERHPAHRPAAGRRGQADGRCRTRGERGRHGGPRKPDDHRPRWRFDRVRGRCFPQALPPERSRRYRPDHGKAASIDTFEAQASQARPWV
jgi:hypothetical protein